jgi:hypothetical protein
MSSRSLISRDSRHFSATRGDRRRFDGLAGKAPPRPDFAPRAANPAFYLTGGAARRAQRRANPAHLAPITAARVDGTPLALQLHISKPATTSHQLVEFP